MGAAPMVTPFVGQSFFGWALPMDTMDNMKKNTKGRSINRLIHYLP
jgi:hypothetical protein